MAHILTWKFFSPPAIPFFKMVERNGKEIRHGKKKNPVKRLSPCPEWRVPFMPAKRTWEPAQEIEHPEQLENSACLSLQVMPVWTSVFLGVKKKSPSGREKIQVSCSRRKPGQRTSPLGQRELFSLQAWTRPEFFRRGCSMLETAVGCPGESQSPFLKGQQGIQRVSETMHISHTKRKLLAANPQLFQVYQKLIRKVVPGPFSFYWGCFINLKFLNILVSE